VEPTPVEGDGVAIGDQASAEHTSDVGQRLRRTLEHDRRECAVWASASSIEYCTCRWEVPEPNTSATAASANCAGVPVLGESTADRSASASSIDSCTNRCDVPNSVTIDGRAVIGDGAVVDVIRVSSRWIPLVVIVGPGWIRLTPHIININDVRVLLPVPTVRNSYDRARISSGVASSANVITLV
jgi:hypothetical protein